MKAVAFTAMGVIGALVLRAESTALALGYAVASRLLYVLYVGLALKAAAWQRRWRTAQQNDTEWMRFRDKASLTMTNDAVALVVACWSTRGTLGAEFPTAAYAVPGALLILIGISCKTWAALLLGVRTYYWYDFFVRPARTTRCRTGPYRFLSNPMYTVGYAHAWGCAILLASWPGLAAAAFAHAAILVFNLVVEQPHVRSEYAQSAEIAS